MIIVVTGLLCQQVYVRYRDDTIIQLNGLVWSSLFGVNLNVQTVELTGLYDDFP